MRRNFGARPILYPHPVFIVGSYDEAGIPNAMNAAWGGIGTECEIFLGLSPEHKTIANILARKAFTVSMGTAAQVAACDYVGLVTGFEVVDKVARAGMCALPSAFVDAPLFEELPMALECKLVHYDQERCCLVGEIVNVCADESILTDEKIDPCKLQPIIYDSIRQTYRVLGEQVGRAFHDGAALK